MEHIHDCVVIGAGPAGMTAAIYMKSEGLDVVVLERNRLAGGQLAMAAKVDNIPGFFGQSGSEIAYSLENTFSRFGGKIFFDSLVTRVSFRDYWKREEDGGEFDIFYKDFKGNPQYVVSRTVVIATGKDFVKPRWIEEVEDFYSPNRFYMPKDYLHLYAACQNESVVIVGGGNSAAQYAMGLSKRASKVTIVCRSGLKCSEYLVKEIQDNRKIFIVQGLAVECNGSLLKCLSNNAIAYVGFHKFLYAGESVHNDIGTGICGNFKIDDPPVNGLYPIGDVVIDHPNRGAAAIGAGAVVATKIHQYLNSGERPKSCFT